MELENLKTEEERILEWRALQLARAGLPDLAAKSLAEAHGLDIEYACRVVRSVLAAGKDYELAVEILL